MSEMLRVAIVGAGPSGFYAAEELLKTWSGGLQVDLYDHDAAAPVLDDAAFYAACHAVLADGGVMTVNLFGRRASFAHSMSRIAEAFGDDALWSLRPTREGNSIVVATRGVPLPARAQLLERAAAIEQRFALPARKWARLLRTWPPT